ncbi:MULTISPECIES: hypothetical protein [Glycomyces]|uniref:XRE family transcriptional regulator n=1 Tax=Glycomyces lechevalierae TaxID=256034 RepID=A0ABU2AIG6_9ACTN|nr:hypothetical protein [Glycomyces lechevalierae]MDR7336770.1 hypothetical protein [Glycomyces lechevalierae]
MLKQLKAEKGWGIVRVADEAEVSRSTLTLWRDGDWTKGVPTRPVVERFCNNLKLKKDEPYAYLRWELDSRERPGRGEEIFEPAPERDLDGLVRRIELRLGQSPPATERRDLERQLVRARRARDAKRLADELIAELEADLDEGRRQA